MATQVQTEARLEVVPDVDEIRRDIVQTLGFVPTLLREMEYEPVLLDRMWTMMKKYTLGESHIPPKYRELTGVAVAASLHCRYCVMFHSEAARMFGATEEEIREAGALAQYTAGGSAFADSRLLDLDTLRDEMRRIGEHMASRP
ncbi:MAG: carboxymuconolactone decarboxylase family protein [Armatimonadetes bacterium]|nr:carboxymuconolactone decarboxylase family protein [Armatimonadota bacterium]